MQTGARWHHLTDDEFSDLLFGEEPDGAVAAHLDFCDHCRTEFAAVGGSLESLREMGTNWSRAKAPLMVAVPSAWARRLVSIPTWSMGLAVTTAAGVLAFGLGLPGGRGVETPEAGKVATPAANANLAEDNRLMLSIDEELTYSTSASVPVSHSEARHGAHHAAETILD